jgi:uncharacterized protein
MKFIVFKDKKGEWRFRLVAANNKIIAIGEGYQRQAKVLKIIETMKIEFKILDVPVEIK